MSHAQLPHILNIGRRQQVPVRDLADASNAYQQARDESGEGGSTFPEGRVKIGSTVYRVSYNGRVWNRDNCILEAQ